MSDNHSDLVAIFTDYDQRAAPLDGRAVRVALVADVLFMEFGTVTETLDDDRNPITTFKGTDAVGVDVELLYETLGAMIRRDDRMAVAAARAGTLPADHPAIDNRQVAGVAQGIRRRA